MPRRAAQDLSPSIEHQLGGLDESPTCSWENTENITAGIACTLPCLTLANWRRLSFTMFERQKLNKIVMGFLFHRLIILGRGVTDLDKQTAAAQTALAEATPVS